MSLRDRLFQSIAALDRIAPPDVETTSQFSAPDEKIPVIDSRPGSIYSQQPCDEKFIRLSTSTLSLPGPYLRRSRSLPSFNESIANSHFAPEIDTSKMDAHGEPKITLRYAAQIARHILTIAFSFLSIGAAIAMIGLAADSINWGTGRGNEAANTVIAVVSGGYDPEFGGSNTWITKMLYLPSYYDTSTFSGLIAAGCVAVLGGVIVAPLSIVYWKSTNRAVELGSRSALSRKWTLLILLVLEAFMFLTTLIVLICVRSLFAEGSGYDPYDLYDEYSIKAEYFDPPLPANRSHEAPAPYDWVPIDDEMRYYRSPVDYNPMNWNCRLQGRVGSSVAGGVSNHRLFQLCEEGNAARWLLVVILALQGAVLASHAWAWVELKRGRNGGWVRQQHNGSGERVAEDEE